jgi:hypothetical protein
MPPAVRLLQWQWYTKVVNTYGTCRRRVREIRRFCVYIYVLFSDIICCVPDLGYVCFKNSAQVLVQLDSQSGNDLLCIVMTFKYDVIG